MWTQQQTSINQLTKSNNNSSSPALTIWKLISDFTWWVCLVVYLIGADQQIPDLQAQISELTADMHDNVWDITTQSWMLWVSKLAYWKASWPAFQNHQEPCTFINWYLHLWFVAILWLRWHLLLCKVITLYYTIKGVETCWDFTSLRWWVSKTQTSKLNDIKQFQGKQTNKVSKYQNNKMKLHKHNEIYNAHCTQLH